MSARPRTRKFRSTGTAPWPLPLSGTGLGRVPAAQTRVRAGMRSPSDSDTPPGSAPATLTPRRSSIPRATSLPLA